MKIAILSFYSGHFERGVERWVEEVANRLSERHEVTVIQNGPKSGERKYKTVSTSLKINLSVGDLSISLARRFFLDYWSRVVALSALKSLSHFFKNEYDIVIPTSGGWQVALIRIMTWLRREKMVIVGHSGKGWDEMNNLFAFPDVFVGLSSFACKWAKSINRFLRTEYIPNGIDVNKFQEKGEKVFLDLERPIFIGVGAFERNKRFELAIEAVAKLKEGSLILLGGGHEEKRIISLGNKMLGKRFLMRKVKFDEVPKYLRSADVFTIPSMDYYSFEMVLLEAMASNLPVVANDDPIRKEIVGDAGILINPEDKSAYSDALIKASEKNWGNKPRERAQKFSWEDVIIKYEKLFNDLVK